MSFETKSYCFAMSVTHKGTSGCEVIRKFPNSLESDRNSCRSKHNSLQERSIEEV